MAANEEEEKGLEMQLVNSHKRELDNETLKGLNAFLKEQEKVETLDLNAQSVNYKQRILETFRLIEDPF